MAFVPTQFGKIGKSVTDFFKKGFEPDQNSLKSKHTTKQGVTLETTATQKNGTTSGQLDATYKCKCLGKVKVETRTEGTVYGTANLARLYQGVTANVEFGQKEHSGSSGLYDVVSVDYNHTDFVAGSVKFNNFTTNAFFNNAVINATKGHERNIEACVSIGTEGVSLGAQAQLNTGSNNQLTGYVDSLNFGAAYASKDFLGFVKSKNLDLFNGSNKSEFTFGAQYTLPQYTFASQFVFNNNPKNRSRVMSVGVDFAADDLTQVKGKYSTNGQVEVAVTRQLQQPDVQLVVSSKFAETNTFGFGVSFGN